MKRKLLSLLMAAAVLLTMSLPAFADVIWEPDNGFYERHREECTLVDRGYLANGPKGYVAVCTAPGSLTEVSNLANGERFHVSHVWKDKDGTEWAVGSFRADDTYQEGWAPLSELALIYDYEEFAADHGREFKEYDGSGDALTSVCLYSYPGGVFSHVLEESKEYMPFSETFQYLYTDGNGLRWTFVGYYMGHRDGWACIDDPMNENLGTETLLTAGQVRGDSDAPVAPAEHIPAAKTFPLWLLPPVLVIVAAVVTALIIRNRNKKSK